MEEIMITELQEKMDSGEYGVRAITEMYLERIEEISKQGPAINLSSNSTRTLWRLPTHLTKSAKKKAHGVRCTASQ